MPIYEYACRACGHEMDALQKMAEAPLLDCPACGQPELKRKISAPSFRLKGQGWYETDFKKDNRRNLAESGESKSETKSDTGTSKKTDTKSSDTASAS
ncbi:MAG: zinc ribbon domain-containing protein [Pseudomonadota bacterium]